MRISFSSSSSRSRFGGTQLGEAVQQRGGINPYIIMPWPFTRTILLYLTFFNTKYRSEDSNNLGFQKTYKYIYCTKDFVENRFHVSS
jgi:hypothetical protein